MTHSHYHTLSFHPSAQTNKPSSPLPRHVMHLINHTQDSTVLSPFSHEGLQVSPRQERESDSDIAKGISINLNTFSKCSDYETHNMGKIEKVELCLPRYFMIESDENCNPPCPSREDSSCGSLLKEIRRSKSFLLKPKIRPYSSLINHYYQNSHMKSKSVPLLPIL
mmetsp:Transcript_10319/g.11794  ORF Transcript_10319/g.11794 Transcript_10319/m.11794 type:complete len:166 (+) Transcript_10319:58-555(+)